MSARRRVVGMLVGAVLLTGCGEPGATRVATAGTDAGTGSVGLAGPLVVFAAASLETTFSTLGASFESENPDVDVSFSFAGSADLVTQLTGGAPADVYAPADTRNMDPLVDAGMAVDPVGFARNKLVIVTPPDNPAGVGSFADLATAGVSVVVCADGVPCGTATRRIEEATGVRLTPVSEEQSVTDVLNKVRTGEADAGLAYVTDARAAGDGVATVPFPEAAPAANTYPIAVLADADNPAAAAAFVALVTGPVGQAVLADAGFTPGS